MPALATPLPEIAGRIRNAAATVTLDLLNKVWTETKYRYYDTTNTATNRVHTLLDQALLMHWVQYCVNMHIRICTSAPKLNFKYP